MTSLKRLEGYMLIDNSVNNGVPDELFVGKYAYLRGLGRGKQEIKTLTCSHCGSSFLENPLRKRERNYCRRCDHYICDNPGCHTGCRPFKALCDQIREDIVQADQSAVDPTARIIIP